MIHLSDQETPTAGFAEAIKNPSQAPYINGTALAQGLAVLGLVGDRRRELRVRHAQIAGAPEVQLENVIQPPCPTGQKCGMATADTFLKESVANIEQHAALQERRSDRRRVRRVEDGSISRIPERGRSPHGCNRSRASGVLLISTLRRRRQAADHELRPGIAGTEHGSAPTSLTQQPHDPHKQHGENTLETSRKHRRAPAIWLAALAGTLALTLPCRQLPRLKRQNQATATSATALATSAPAHRNRASKNTVSYSFHCDGPITGYEITSPQVSRHGRGRNAERLRAALAGADV